MRYLWVNSLGIFCLKLTSARSCNEQEGHQSDSIILQVFSNLHNSMILRLVGWVQSVPQTTQPPRCPLQSPATPGPSGALPAPGLTLDGPAALLAVVEGEEVVGVAVAAAVGELLAALRVPVVVPARHHGAAGPVVGGQQAGALLLCGDSSPRGWGHRAGGGGPGPAGSHRGPAPTCEGALGQRGAGQQRQQQQRGQGQAAAGGHGGRAGGSGVRAASSASRSDGSALYAPRRLPRAASLRRWWEGKVWFSGAGGRRWSGRPRGAESCAMRELGGRGQPPPRPAPSGGAAGAGRGQRRSRLRAALHRP